MKEYERVQVESRAEWRAWLAANYGREAGVWLVTFKRPEDARHVPYEDVVQEALCFGWIDSTLRKVDEARNMILMSPRRKGSTWAQSNKQRVEQLLAAGLMQPPGLAAIEQAKADGSWTMLDDVEALIVPQDLAAALAENEAAQRHFEGFSDSSKKMILWWIKSAKRDETRRKRIAETVRLAQENVRAAG